MNAVANVAERVLREGHDGATAPNPSLDNITTDINNPGNNSGRYADPSGEKMKALVWNGKNSVEVGEWYCFQLLFNDNAT